MPLVLADRVQETSTSPGGTGTLNLSGTAPAGFKTFSSGIGTGNSTYYCIFDTTAYDWEVGIGTYTSGSPGTLSRTTVLSNSAGTTSKINFTNGNTLNIFVTYPSEKSVNQDSSGAVNILTNVPNTTTSIGTLNVGDGTYNFSQLGQLATFASAEPVVNTVTVQNTSSSNTAYSSIQIGADNYNNGYFIELGTNSSTYSYSAAGYPNSSINQPNVNYILANKADLGIATWDNKNIHFIQNASTTTTDSMTLYASGGVSLGGNPDPGLGALYANNVYLGFTQITAAAGTTVLTNASAAWQQVVGTTTQTIQLPNATTLYKGLAFTITNSSTGNVTVKDNASTTLDTIVTGGSAIMVLTANGTSAGTWVAYSYVPSSYDFSTSTANFGSAAITNAVWNGTTVSTGYGGTGLTSFTSGGALYATSGSALTSGTLPVTAGGTGATTLTSNGIVYGSGTASVGVTAAGTTGQVLVGNTGAAPSWSSLSSIGVTTFSAGTTGLTPSTATSGAVTLAGTLGIANGGTGQTSFTAGQIHYGSFSTSSNLYFDGTNLGVGTSSPSYKLEVYDATNPRFSLNTGASGISELRFSTPSSGYQGLITYSAASNFMAFYTGATERMRLDSSGNLGLGVTPKAWSSSYKAFQVGSQGSFWANASGGDIYLSSNYYFDGSQKYIANGYASFYSQNNGSHNWQIAPSGTAGNAITFTQAMTLDASGRLGINQTSPSYLLDVYLASSGNMARFSSGSGVPTFIASYGSTGGIFAESGGNNGWGYNASSNYIVSFTNGTERMRIDSSGNVGIGTSSPVSTSGIKALTVYAATDVPSLYLQNSTTGTAYTDGFSLGMSGTDVYFNNREAGNALFYVNGSERMRIDSSGNLLVGTTTAVAQLTVANDMSATWHLNPNTISANYTVPANYNAMSAGPITINTGVTVTVSTGSTWVIA